MHSPLYVAARRTLLDAMGALSAHRDALVVIGAHAVYLRVPEDDLAVAPMTTDADIGLNPELLATAPLLADDMEKAGFKLSAQPGIWTSPAGPTVDLIVPEALAGAGRRSAPGTSRQQGCTQSPRHRRVPRRQRHHDGQLAGRVR